MTVSPSPHSSPRRCKNRGITPLSLQKGEVHLPERWGALSEALGARYHERMLLLTLALTASANPGPRLEWDAEVDPIGALPAYVEELLVLASPDPARLARDLLDTDPGMRPSLEWDGRGDTPGDESTRQAALLDLMRMFVIHPMYVNDGGCRIGPQERLQFKWF